jgi:hypothetical protein
VAVKVLSLRQETDKNTFYAVLFLRLFNVSTLNWRKYPPNCSQVSCSYVFLHRRELWLDNKVLSQGESRLSTSRVICALVVLKGKPLI